MSVWPNLTVKAVIMDPEIVFVANLTNADAPALKVSFQCDFSLTSGKVAQRMTAQVKAFKVLACAFLKDKQDKNVTTVRKLVFIEKNITRTVSRCVLQLAYPQHSENSVSVSLIIMKVGGLWYAI